ncbi:MAG TPA: histidinol dehydrogenase, partial [Thiothrix sp.]|nr:histidinol dehydrogenase [Thiothrix sp.]
MISIKELNKQEDNFWQEMETLLAWESVSDASVLNTVNDIIADIRKRGDAALVDFTNRFDRMSVEDISALEISAETLETSVKKITEAQKQALEFAAERIKSYAQHQKMESWSYTEADGTMLGQQVTALDKVGLYVP